MDWNGYGDVFRGRERYTEDNTFYKYTETDKGALRAAHALINVSGDLTLSFNEASEENEARIGKYVDGYMELIKE